MSKYNKSLGMDWHSPKHKRPIGTTTMADGQELALIIKKSKSWEDVLHFLIYPSTEQIAVVERYKELNIDFELIKSSTRV